MHVGALRKAMLFFLDGKECEDDAMFSLNLLLQAGYDKSKQEELMGKLGASFKLIESVLGTLIKFRGIVSKENTGTTPTMKELPNTQQKTRTSENSHACEKNMDNKTRL